MKGLFFFPHYYYLDILLSGSLCSELNQLMFILCNKNVDLTESEDFCCPTDTEDSSKLRHICCCEDTATLSPHTARLFVCMCVSVYVCDIRDQSRQKPQAFQLPSLETKQRPASMTHTHTHIRCKGDRLLVYGC